MPVQFFSLQHIPGRRSVVPLYLNHNFQLQILALAGQLLFLILFYSLLENIFFFHFLKILNLIIYLLKIKQLNGLSIYFLFNLSRFSWRLTHLLTPGTALRLASGISSSQSSQYIRPFPDGMLFFACSIWLFI